jgi:hypothetical protein
MDAATVTGVSTGVLEPFQGSGRRGRRHCQRPPALLLRSAERTLRVPLARELCRSAPFFGPRKRGSDLSRNCGTISAALRFASLDSGLADTFLRTWLLGDGVSEEVATLARTWLAWAWAVRGCVRQNAAGCFSGDRAISGIGLIFEIPASRFHEREMKRSWHAIPAFLRTQPRGIMAPRRDVLAQTRSCERGYFSQGAIS